MNDDDIQISYSSCTDSCIPTPSNYTITLDHATDATTFIDNDFDTTFVSDTGTEYTYNMRRQPNNWPSEYELNDMLTKYPALKIAYGKFIEVYNLVKDDYFNQQEDIDVF
tara:strand:+ start:375 stop:704 length:330 start_codon:yes stop_codon:yes gene_type:complete